MKRTDREGLFSGKLHIKREFHQSIVYLDIKATKSTCTSSRWIRICQVMAGVGIVMIGLWTYLFNIHIRTIRWYNYNDSSFCGDDIVHSVRFGDSSCRRPMPALNSTELDQARHLLVLALRVLKGQGVRAALCHGSLWGVLRRGDLLPCDPAADLCVLDSELYKEATTKEARESRILKTLRHNFSFVSQYDHWMGLYRLKFNMDKDNNRDIGLNLRVFSDCTGFYYWSHWSQYKNDYPDYLSQPEPDRPRWACPVALSFYVFHWTSDGYQGFPKMLLEPPFRNLTLGGFKVPVPNDDYEMQKYIYPNDWWMETSPPCCDFQH